ncbi:MAG: hypothetical protein M1829_005591 [Trizodia sp. TS-e1964]|nr:MAG: hypothetical protein M1829_005591 [Trizodia sp. TS-e1964]
MLILLLLLFTTLVLSPVAAAHPSRQVLSTISFGLVLCEKGKLQVYSGKQLLGCIDKSGKYSKFSSCGSFEVMEENGALVIYNHSYDPQGDSKYTYTCILDRYSKWSPFYDCPSSPNIKSASQLYLLGSSLWSLADGHPNYYLNPTENQFLISFSTGPYQIHCENLAHSPSKFDNN